MKPAPHISVVINAHREGLIATPSLRSVSRAKQFANAKGYSVEVIVVLDKADDLTRQVVKGWDEAGVQVVELSLGDLGLARNHGVKAASGEFVAFLDADDLFGENWLGEALDAAAHDRRNIIWHPEVNIYFGLHNHIFRHIDMEADEFDRLSLAAGNCWTSLCVARRDFLSKTPYPATDLSKRIGFEDWGWYRQTIAAGAIHKNVKGTGHAIRTKAGSLVKLTAASSAIPCPTDLFRKLLDERARRKEVRSSVGPGNVSRRTTIPGDTRSG